MKKINNSECLISFGKYIRKARKARHLYQSDVAFLVGISQVQLSYIENGKREPDLVLALNLCNALGVDMKDFIDQYL